MSNLYSKFKKLFFKEKIIIAVVLINTIIITLQEFKINSLILSLIDIGCILFFIIEMIVKQKEFGFKQYWKTPLNCLDGVLVIISIPSLIVFFTQGSSDLSFLLVLRMFRIFKFFGLVRFFPDFKVIASNFKIAIHRSYAVLLIFIIIILTFALISCSIFGESVPQYFSTPFDSVYTIFRIFTVEGWYEIPDTIGAIYGSETLVYLIRLYFCILLIFGGIIGMSLINSIFVDAMVSDNNDELKVQLDRVEAKLDKLLAQKSLSEEDINVVNEINNITKSNKENLDK